MGGFAVGLGRFAAGLPYLDAIRAQQAEVRQSHISFQPTKTTRRDRTLSTAPNTLGLRTDQPPMVLPVLATTTAHTRPKTLKGL